MLYGLAKLLVRFCMEMENVMTFMEIRLVLLLILVSLGYHDKWTYFFRLKQKQIGKGSLHQLCTPNILLVIRMSLSNKSLCLEDLDILDNCYTHIFHLN